MTAGGGGKTPVVMWLAETLSKKGVKTAILSRGYGRMGRETLLVDPEGPWENFGDEPSLMAGKLRDVAVAVSGNRRLAGLELLKHRDVDLFILDDGFQHHALEKDLDIVVIDDQRRFGNGRLLPAGALREPVTRLLNADYIIVTKSRHRDFRFESYLNQHSPAPVLWSRYRPAGLCRIGSGKTTGPDSDLRGPFVAFCGIAVPEGFRKTLDDANIEVAQFLTFPDHHPYSTADADTIMDAAVRSQAVGLVTTEKDAVRWPCEGTPLPVYSLAVDPVIDDAQEMVQSIRKLIQKAPGEA
jgi:tetraacyldisaccharide 4'-kinase